MRWVLMMVMGLGAAAASAQQPPSERVRYRPITTLDFTGLEVEGELQRPDGAYLRTRRQTRFRNLIELRAHFRPELMQSAQEL